MENTLTRQEELLATSNVYALLGRLWLQEIDDSLLAEFRAEPLRSAFKSVGGKSTLNEREDLESLAAEYCRLFVGPKGHFPPMQSVWQEGKLDSKVTASVRSFGEAVGYQPSPDYPSTMVDHLGVELEIMSRLVHVLASQFAIDQPSDETYACAQEFFRRHLCWPERLIGAAIKSAEAGFYRTLLDNTRDFLEADKVNWVTPG